MKVAAIKIGAHFLVHGMDIGLSFSHRAGKEMLRTAKSRSGHEDFNNFPAKTCTLCEEILHICCIFWLKMLHILWHILPKMLA